MRSGRQVVPPPNSTSTRMEQHLRIALTATDRIGWLLLITVRATPGSPRARVSASPRLPGELGWTFSPSFLPSFLPFQGYDNWYVSRELGELGVNLLSFLPLHIYLYSLIGLVARRLRRVDLRNRCLNHRHMLNCEGDRIFREHHRDCSLIPTMIVFLSFWGCCRSSFSIFSCGCLLPCGCPRNDITNLSLSPSKFDGTFYERRYGKMVSWLIPMSCYYAVQGKFKYFTSDEEKAFEVVDNLFWDTVISTHTDKCVNSYTTCICSKELWNALVWCFWSRSVRTWLQTRGGYMVFWKKT